MNAVLAKIISFAKVSEQLPHLSGSVCFYKNLFCQIGAGSRAVKTPRYPAVLRDSAYEWLDENFGWVKRKKQ